MGGVKCSWISGSYGNVSLICSYSNVRNNNPDCVLQSHVFSASSRYTHDLPLNKNVSIIPLAQVDFAQIIAQSTKIKDIQVNHENSSDLRAAGGVNLQFYDDVFKFSLGVKISKNFRKGGDKSFNGININSSREISASYVEYNAKLSGKIDKGLNIDLAIGKSCGGRKGFSANLTLAATL
jgi:hypothetical protein